MGPLIHLHSYTLLSVPGHVLVDRCSGSCHSPAHFCAPISAVNVSIPVMAVETTFSAGAWRTKCAEVTVVSHTRCACTCNSQPADCSPDTQFYDAAGCKCRCKDQVKRCNWREPSYSSHLYDHDASMVCLCAFGSPCILQPDRPLGVPGGRKAVGLRHLLLLLPPEALEVLLHRLHLRLQRLLRLCPHLRQCWQYQCSYRCGRHRRCWIPHRWCFSDALEAPERATAEQHEEVQSTGEAPSQERPLSVFTASVCFMLCLFWS